MAPESENLRAGPSALPEEMTFKMPTIHNKPPAATTAFTAIIATCVRRQT